MDRFTIAEEAAELAISLWKADFHRAHQGEIIACNDFIFGLKERVDSKQIQKKDTDLALIIIHILGFTSSVEIGKIDEISTRMETAKRALKKILLPSEIHDLLGGMINCLEAMCFPEREVDFDFEKLHNLKVPDFLREFLSAFEKYKLRRK